MFMALLLADNRARKDYQRSINGQERDARKEKSSICDCENPKEENESSVASPSSSRFHTFSQNDKVWKIAVENLSILFSRVEEVCGNLEVKLKEGKAVMGKMWRGRRGVSWNLLNVCRECAELIHSRVESTWIDGPVLCFVEIPQYSLS